MLQQFSMFRFLYNNKKKTTQDTLKQIHTNESSVNQQNNANLNCENEEEPSCRICYDGFESGRMISPCNCIGTQKYVHISCLKKWLRHSKSPHKCSVCNSNYLFEDTTTRRIMLSKPFTFALTTVILVILAHLTGFLFRCLMMITNSNDLNNLMFWDQIHCKCGMMLLAVFGVHPIFLAQVVLYASFPSYLNSPQPSSYEEHKPYFLFMFIFLIGGSIHFFYRLHEFLKRQLFILQLHLSYCAESKSSNI
eukprot:gb/GECH01001672.1/.p1 GENE.gb/GECH01001672.1/~~gb/GECH01001672.1/.p1  ORF type:complete len:250 (+),score=33.12 gb/GECH01001672.1/:1-750(+)